MFDRGAYPRLEPGHVVGMSRSLPGSARRWKRPICIRREVFIEFIHLCPGENCAVERWLAQRMQREDDESPDATESMVG